MVLTFGLVLSKIIGALYRIPLTNILGAEGMGMYQLVFPVYALFTVLATAGVPTALSRIIAEKNAFGLDSSKNMRVAVVFVCIICLICVVLIEGLALHLARWQGNENTATAFRIVAPAVFFVGITACFRGWFQGYGNMTPTAVSNILEQVVKLSVGLGLAIAFAKSKKSAMEGAFFGVTIAELFSMVYLFVNFLIKRKRYNSSDDKTKFCKQDGIIMLKVALPIALVSIILPLTNFFDSLLIVNLIKIGGLNTSQATAHYGLLSGPVNSLINLPIVAILSLAVVIVPTVSTSRVEHDIFNIISKSKLSIKLAYIFGVPSSLFFLLFAKDILALIYPNLSADNLEIASKLLILVSPNVIFLAVMQIYVSLLQGLDKTKYAVISLMVAAVIKIVITAASVKFVGIIGAGIASLIMGFVALIGVNLSFYKLTSLHIEKNVATICVLGAIMLLLGYGIKQGIFSPVVRLLVGVITFIFVYGWLLLMTSVLTNEEINQLPLGKYILKIRRFARFWEQGDYEN